jgi:putative transcriptional regulator
MATVRITPEMIGQAMLEVNWERQDALTDKDIAAQIAANPDAAPDLSDFPAEAIFVQRVRRKLGLSQSAFATRYRIPLRTLQQWEQGRREPDATALAYLKVIEREPEAAARALVGV